MLDLYQQAKGISVANNKILAEADPLLNRRKKKATKPKEDETF